MFRSSQNLRLAAEMRALQRVAGPWRAARTTWFDGSPDSIAARIAATDRVLTFARSGYTPAHIGLEREAAAARAELVAARDRLLTDPIDDTARRTASQDEMLDCPHCGTASDVLDFTVQGGHCPVCGHYHYDGDLARHYGSRRTADETTGFGDPGYGGFGDDDFAKYDDYLRRHDYHTDPHALEHRLRPGYDDDPARYSHLRRFADDSGGSGVPYSDFNSSPVVPYRSIGDLGMAPGGVGAEGAPASTPYSEMNIGGDGVSNGGFNKSDGSARGPAGGVSILQPPSGGNGPSIEHSNANPVETLNNVPAVGTTIADPTGGILSGPYLGNPAPSSGGSASPGSNGGSSPAPASGGGMAQMQKNSLRLAAIDFVADQNTTDRGELLFRAHRHASNRTGQLPVAQARAAVKAFVAAVLREAAAGPQKVRKAHRTAATLPDFDDQLLFDS